MALGSSKTPEVIFKVCPLFNETMSQALVKGKQKLADRFLMFKNSKAANPLQPFGKSDKPFISTGVLKDAVPGETMLHAHLTHDLSILYTLTGSDPKFIKLYAVYGHDEIGTGTPPNIRKQQQAAAKLTSQGGRFT
jgi:hypothetical protein